ncbi:GNAT family N-acetyltransferase [Ralstonia pickettii]|uniref:GNAT family N-acetyltransferase n=1 Tax=Ralstonia pickettii TaxID=329 RepID=UPI0015BE606F|nr:GNAT family N-acetyltransferase [Ralstonia pickettii]NWK46027.1 GNAT family N-acetyltransferase [Ralstonia pickettii]
MAIAGGTLQIARVERPEDIKERVLQARAIAGWRDAWTNGFVASAEGCELGLLLLDFYERILTARVYEIFVLERFRQRRIAAGLMEFAEMEARSYGAKILELEAHPLDLSTDLSTLRRWYSALGFEGESDARLMKKAL